ncbi:MAG: NPCBM/NEW2 domain-containing protein [Bacteroidales bacterium]|nr:NPCBM/NEW2 domain-containing protein [Bacteroidales bacterium]
MMMLHLPILSVVVLLAAPPQLPPRFHAETTDAPRTGFLQSLDASGNIRMEEETSEAVPLVELRQIGQVRPPRPRSPLLLFSNGDAIPATVLSGDRSTLQVQPTLPHAPSQPWTVPLTALAAVWLVPPPARLPLDPARYPWRETARRQDAVLLRNGDVVLGTFAVLGESQTLRLITQRGQPPRVLPLDQVAAVAFDPTLSRPRKLKGVAARVVGTDGSRLSLTQVTSAGATLQGETSFGQKVQLPLARIAALDVLGGPAVYLSDLKPQSATTEPYLSVSWPWVADRSVKRHTLRIAGPHGVDQFDKGLGTHPRTRLVYNLAGRYRRFDAQVGLDTASGSRGAAGVTILVDGQPQDYPALRHLTAATSPVSVRVPITEARELTLLVDFSTTGDVQADVNWGNARFVE